MDQIIQNKKRYEVLAEEIAQRSYGDIVSHSEIAQIIKEAHGTQKYNTVVQQMRKMLLDTYGMVLESMRGVGYRIVSPDDYVQHSLRHYKRGFHEFQKGADTLDCAPVNDMSDEGRVLYQRVNDRAALLHASIKGALVELRTLGEKKHPFAQQHLGC